MVGGSVDGPRRFGDLQQALPGIAPNVLTQRLRRLEGEGLVVAQPYSERPQRYVYELTASGHGLAGALRLLADWGARHGDAVEPPAARGVRHAGRGALVVPDVRASRGRRRGRRPALRLTGRARFSLQLLPSPPLDDQPTRRLDTGGGPPPRPPRRPGQQEPDSVYMRRRMVAAGAAAVVLLLLIVVIASGGDDEPETSPSDLGVPTTESLGDRGEETETTETEETDTEGESATPVTPVAPAPEPGTVTPTPAPPSQGTGGGAGEPAPEAPPPPQGGEGGGAVAPPSDGG